MNLNDAAKLGKELEYKMFEKRKSELSILRDEFITFPDNFVINYNYRRIQGHLDRSFYEITKKSDKDQILKISKDDDLFNDIRYYLLYKSQCESEQKPNNIHKQRNVSFLRNFIKKLNFLSG